MELLFDLLWWSTGEVLFANTGYAVIYLLTFGQVKPSQVSEGVAVAVGIAVWLAVITAGIILYVRWR